MRFWKLPTPLSVIVTVAVLAATGNGAIGVESVARAADTTVGIRGRAQAWQLPGQDPSAEAMSGLSRLGAAGSTDLSRPLAPSSPVSLTSSSWALPDATQPIPPPGPIDDTWYCPGLLARVPREALKHALDDPATVAGYKQACNPSLPPGPHNPLRIDLGLQNPNLPYHPLFNGLAWRCGCR